MLDGVTVVRGIGSHSTERGGPHAVRSFAFGLQQSCRGGAPTGSASPEVQVAPSRRACAAARRRAGCVRDRQGAPGAARPCARAQDWGAGPPRVGLGAVVDGAQPQVVLNEEAVAQLEVPAAYIEAE